MATGPATQTTERADVHAAAHGADHPKDRDYFVVALILGIITAAEVAVSYIDYFKDNSTALLLALLPLMVIKFSMVAWFFMHLKQDSRVFSRLFVTGIALATAVYMIVLFAFDEFF